MMRTPSTHERHAAAALVAATLLCLHTAGAQEIALSYTTTQAQRGKAAYEPDCLPCHGANLNDGPLGPPLKGAEFIAKYGGKTADNLFKVMRTRMPSPAPGALEPDVYAAIMAYVLQQNDIVAGERELTANVNELARMWVPAGGFSFMTFSPLPREATRRQAERARALHAGHGRAAAQSTRDRVARVAPDLRHARLQPAQADRQTQRRAVARRVDLVAAAGLERVRTADARRRAVRIRLRRSAAGARRTHRRPAVALHASARIGRTAEPQTRHRAVWQQRLHRHLRRASDRTRRAHRQARVGHEDRGLHASRKHLGRTARRRRQGHDRHDGHGRRRRARRAADRWRGRRDGRRRMARAHDRAARHAGRRQLERRAGRAAQRRVGVEHRQLRSRARPRLLRHRQHVRHRAAARRAARRQQRGAVHGFDARDRCENGPARVGVPASAERSMGSRLVVRDAARETAVARRAAHGDAVVRQDRHLRSHRRRDGPVRVRARPGSPEHRDRDQSRNGREDDQSRGHARRRQAEARLPARRRREELPARLLRRGIADPDRAAERSVHGHVSGARRRRWRRIVLGHELGHPADSRQRRQIRPAASDPSRQASGRVANAAARTAELGRACDRGRRSVRGLARSVSARLRQRQRPTALGTTLERRVELEPDDVQLGRPAVRGDRDGPGRLPRRELCRARAGAARIRRTRARRSGCSRFRRIELRARPTASSALAGWAVR